MSSSTSLEITERLTSTRSRAGGGSDVWLAHLPLLVLVGGCLNGWCASVVHGLQQGYYAPWHAISPIELFAVLAALVSMRSCLPPAPPVAIVSLIAALGLVVPSSVVAWAVTGAYALYCSRRGPSAWRTGALLFAALAGCSVWSVLLSRFAILPIATAEAAGVAIVLGLFRSDVAAVGNSVASGDAHAIVVLTACSAAAAVPRVLLGVASVAVFLGRDTGRRFVVALALTGLAAFLAVEVRLDLMAWSSGVYDAVHGPVGSNLFDLLQIGLVLVGGVAACRR